MIYGAWVEQELDFYQQEMQKLEGEELDKLSRYYLERKLYLQACLDMLEELAEPVESDPA